MKTIHPRKLTDIEIVTDFPDEAREYLPKAIRKLKRVIAKMEKEIEELILFINKQTADEFTRWFCYEVIKIYKMPELNKCNDILFHQQIQWSLLNPNKQNAHMPDFQNKIRIAKEYPIHELAQESLELQPSGANYKTLCIFHEEKHASMIIFPTTNTFKCFSCGKGGDIINLTMALHGNSFTEAVNMLNQKSGR
jgi:hypothetical protein